MSPLGIYLKNNIFHSNGRSQHKAGNEQGNYVFLFMHSYFIYILSNKHHTVYYTGFTNNLGRRIEEHKQKVVKGFTNKYNCDKLLYYEEFTDMDEALYREKQIKKYRRNWKENLIESINPEWRDLFEDFKI